MFKTDVSNEVNQIIAVFYALKLWNIKDDAAAGFYGNWPKYFHFTYYTLFVLSVAVKACATYDKDETVKLTVSAIIIVVHLFRLWFTISKQSKILTLICQFGIHSTNEPAKIHQVEKKLNNWIKFTKFIILMCTCGVIFISIFPLLSREKLLFNNAFPSDGKQSQIVIWIFCHLFNVVGSFYSVLCFSLSVIIWYLMINGAIKYELLGNQLTKMGAVTRQITDAATLNVKVSKIHRQKFSDDLIEAIRTHQNVKDAINDFSSNFSNLFLIQVVTSSITICGTVYILAFSSHDNWLKDGFFCIIFLYNLFDIFVIMYLGNEIRLASDRMSNCLFESNWTEQTHLCKKKIIVMMEVLKKPQELIIGKLYPLNLDTFTSIANCAYSLFNILQNSNR